MIAVLLAAAVASASDVSVVAGVSRVAPTPMEASPGRLAAGFTVGHAFGELPARLEFQTTFGSSDRDGTSEVWVQGSNAEFALLGGWHPTLVEHRAIRFGLDLLAGPALTSSRTTTSLFGEEERTVDWHPRAALSIGPWTRLGPVQIAARFQGYAPIAPQWTAFGTVGIAF